MFLFYSSTLGFFNFESPINLVILAVIALLVFGRRLPEVGRNLGKGIVEFKKGLAGIGNDVGAGSGPAPSSSQHLPKELHEVSTRVSPVPPTKPSPTAGGE